jgi:hypothetical protein
VARLSKPSQLPHFSTFVFSFCMLIAQKAFLFFIFITCDPSVSS